MGGLYNNTRMDPIQYPVVHIIEDPRVDYAYYESQCYNKKPLKIKEIIN